jgi:hypothetical protein
MQAFSGTYAAMAILSSGAAGIFLMLPKRKKKYPPIVSETIQ